MSCDLNDAQPQMAPIGELIPDGTFAKVRLTIRPGGVNGASRMDAGLLKECSPAMRGSSIANSPWLEVAREI